MTRFLLVMIAFSFIACNSNKEKTGTTSKTLLDTSTTNDIVTRPPDQETISVTDTSPVHANRLIVPGKSIGLTSLDQKNAEALQHLGPPAMEDAGMGKEFATWYTIHGKDTLNEMNIFFVTNMGNTDEASRVKYIRVTSYFFATAEHIGTGSAFNAIKKYFPGIKSAAHYTSPKTKKPVTIYEDEKAGISFEIDDKNICVGITVQKPGEFASEIYISLFPGIVFPRDH
jgi:hypothetical protein